MRYSQNMMSWNFDKLFRFSHTQIYIVRSTIYLNTNDNSNGVKVKSRCEQESVSTEESLTLPNDSDPKNIKKQFTTVFVSNSQNTILPALSVLFYLNRTTITNGPRWL